MALLGMQADMQYKSYFPGHYTTRDLNLDSNSSLWPLNNTDKIFMNGHDYNSALLLPSPHQHLVHNKEVLKQTMIKQEALFRDQIHELHRLYWRQKDLMDEMKSKLLRHQPQLETLPSNPLLSQNSCDYAQKTCHVSLPPVKPALDRLCVSTAENNLPFLCFNDGESMHAGPDPAQTKFSLKGCELESKCMKYGKKILDLELPPDEYIDSEEDESLQQMPKVSVYPLKRVSEIVNNSDQQPYHGSCFFKSVLQEGILTPGSISFKKKYLADLNEPIKLEEEADSMSIYVADLNEPARHEEEAAPKFKFLADLNEPIKLEEEAGSMSSDLRGPHAGQREFPCQDLSQKSNSGPEVFSTDLMQNTKTRNNFETCSEGRQLETNKTQELPSYENQAGQSGSNIASLSPGLSIEGSTSLEDFELKQNNEFPRSYVTDQSDRKSCSEGSESLAKELSSNSYPDIGTCQLISLTDVGNSEASSVLSWRKHVRDIMRTPIAIQALPCFKTSAPFGKSSKSSTASLGLTSKKYHQSNNFKSGLKFDGPSSHQRSLCSRSHSESKRLESYTPSISFDGLDCCTNNDFASEQHCPTKLIRCSMRSNLAKDMDSNLNICSSGREMMLEGLSQGLPWLKTKSMCKRKRGRRSELSTRMESDLEQANSLSLHDVEPKKVEASNNSTGKLVLGVRKIYNKLHISSGQSSSHSSPSKTQQNPPEDEDFLVTDSQMDCDSVAKSRKRLTQNEDIAWSGVYEKISDFGVSIDLNSIIDEHECSPAHSLSPQIDLEAPASPENKERSPPRGESDENPVKRPFQFSGKEDEYVPEDFVGNAVGSIMSGQKGGDVQEELVRIAAKAIVSISSCTAKTCPETAACKPSEPCWSDELFWFAGVVSLVVDDPDSAFGVALSCKNSNDNNECLYDGLDYFEAMTLKLTETKVEEQWYKSNGQKDQKEEEIGATSLPSQTRGRMRRRRQQRKDFQSEILPSLASLSRYEVTEDLQTIEGLIEAASNSWGAVSTRNVGRTSRQKGRRRSCISASNITENTICSLIKQQASCRENGMEERTLIGWGKITRRRRGPRCPAINAGLIQGQVQ